MKLYFTYLIGSKRITIEEDIQENIEYTFAGLKLVLNHYDNIYDLKIMPSTFIEIDKIELEYAKEFSLDDHLFFNGYQGWSYSYEDDIYTKKVGFDGISFMKKVMLDKFYLDRYGDYDFSLYPNKKGYNHSWSYFYIRNGLQYELFGSLNEDFAFTKFVYELNKKVITISPDLNSYQSEKEFLALRFCILNGNENEVFDKWFELMKIEKPKAKKVLGYTSWYNHYQNIDEEKINNDFTGIKSLPTKVDIFQIDDGWERKVGDWLETDDTKFKNGLKDIVDKIHDNNLLAGLWLAPFSAEKESELFKKHQDWFIKDNNGEPYICGCNWSSFYSLDIYNQDVRKYLENVFDKVFNEWGFDLVKLDFLYSACALSRKDKPRGEIMADGMKFLRELCGNKLILGCGVPLASAFGRVDYCRIGCDVSLEYDDVIYMRKAHPERTSTKHSMIDTIFRRQLDGRAFLNDPDVFILRDENVKMSAKQKENLAIINGLFGSVLFMSDDASKYNEEKLALYKKIINLKDKVISVDSNNREIIVIYADEGTKKEIRIKR